MNKIMRFLMWGAGILLLLVVVAITAFALLFDPNAFRDDITRLVEKKTGRQLTIEGDLSLSFFPWLGFEAGRTTLSNPPGFGQPHMVTFDAASASVKLMPLLSKRVELSQIRLDGADLNLVRNKSGKSNWEDLQALGGTDDATAAAPKEGGFSTDGVGGLQLSNTRLTYIDEQSGSDYRISELNLETGALRPGSAFTLAASGNVVSASPALAGPATVKGDVSIDDAGVLRIGNPELEITASGKDIPGDRLGLQLSGPSLEYAADVLKVESPVLRLSGTGTGDPYASLEATVTAGALTLTGADRFDLPALNVVAKLTGPNLPDKRLDVSVTGERLQGSLEHQSVALDVVRTKLLDLTVFSPKVKGSAIFDAPVIEGKIEIAEFSPVKTLKKLGYTDIVTADPAALTSSQLSAELKYDPKATALKSLQARVDQTAVTGSVTVTGAGQIRFNLNADEVDLDRYRAPAPAGQGDGEAMAIEDIEIPSEQLKALNLDGSLNVGKMRLVGLNTSNVKITLKAADGDIRVSPASADLYGGTYQGEIRMNVQGAKPVLSLNERLQNVQFGPFSKDLMDADRISGRLDGRITATGTGSTANAITASTNGDAVFSFADGAYEGTDIWHRVRRARAVIEGKAPPADPPQPRTRFADLSGTAKIVDGVMRSDDIAMVLPFMKVKGAGSLELLSQKIDFRFKGDIVDRPELDATVEDLVGYTIPFKMTGTVSAPDVGVDMGSVLAEVAKRKLADKLGIDKLLGRGKDAPAEGEAVAGEEKPKSAKEELEEKLKGKLKDIFGDG